MIRGTTPTHTFALPFDASVIEKVRIIYAQGGKKILVKTEADATMSGNTISVKLKQEETLRFDCKRSVEIQIRVLTPSDDAFASDIMRVPVDRCLDGEVMV